MKIKAIYCKRCDSYWDIPEEIITPGECPYCGVSFNEHNMDGREALKYIFQSYGYGVMKEADKLSELIEKYLEEQQRWDRALKIAIREGAGKYFYRVYEKFAMKSESKYLNFAKNNRVFRRSK